jgi:hypothetical protein
MLILEIKVADNPGQTLPWPVKWIKIIKFILIFVIITLRLEGYQE